ncbi:MAG: hypothetical protein ACQER7_05215 [Bacteroidota bacterium]
MKQHNLIAFSLIFFILSCTNNQSYKTEDNETVSEVLPVNQVMEAPGKYVENQITVKGMVTHVCRHGGKRLHLSLPGSDVKLRVRTGENVSPFERSLEGDTVRVSGKFIEERFDQGYLEKLRKDKNTEKHQESEHDNASSSEGGVSQAYINELEQKIENTEKGYISEYWLTAEKVTKE